MKNRTCILTVIREAIIFGLAAAYFGYMLLIITELV